MKRFIILIMGLMVSYTAFAQKTVAVYVTSSSDVPQATTKILSSELVAAITRNADYIAIERADEFMAQLTEEQGRYNNIDDAKLFELGRKYGASNVCIAEITRFWDEYYIVARLLDIRTSRVWKTARKSSELKSLGELIEVSEALADDLIGNTKEYSTYAYGDNSSNRSFITRIENRENYTRVSLKYVSTSQTQTIGIKNSTYIEDLVTHEKYMLKDASNINIIDGKSQAYKTIGKGIWEYSLFFNRISEDTKNIRIIEPDGWAYKDIILRPYGDDNTFVFEDNTQDIYYELTKQYSGELQLKEGKYIGDISEGKPHGQGILYYNNDNSDSPVRYEGEWTNGLINGRGIMTFKNGRYEGYLKDGEPNGQGIIWTSDGVKMEGTFKNGKLNGYCTITKEDAIIMCTMVNNKMDGEVIKKDPNGHVEKARFSNGIQITNWK